MKTKLFTVALLWVTISYSLTFVVVPWAVRLILVAIAVAVSVHIVLIPTLRK